MRNQSVAPCMQAYIEIEGALVPRRWGVTFVAKEFLWFFDWKHTLLANSHKSASMSFSVITIKIIPGSIPIKDCGRTIFSPILVVRCNGLLGFWVYCPTIKVKWDTWIFPERVTKKMNISIITFWSTPGRFFLAILPCPRLIRIFSCQ